MLGGSSSIQYIPVPLSEHDWIFGVTVAKSWDIFALSQNICEMYILYIIVYRD